VIIAAIEQDQEHNNILMDSEDHHPSKSSPKCEAISEFWRRHDIAKSCDDDQRQ
jgi:hypothetical protein